VGKKGKRKRKLPTLQALSRRLYSACLNLLAYKGHIHQIGLNSSMPLKYYQLYEGEEKRTSKHHTGSPSRYIFVVNKSHQFVVDKSLPQAIGRSDQTCQSTQRRHFSG